MPTIRCKNGVRRLAQVDSHSESTNRLLSDNVTNGQIVPAGVCIAPLDDLSLLYKGFLLIYLPGTFLSDIKVRGSKANFPSTICL